MLNTLRKHLVTTIIAALGLGAGGAVTVPPIIDKVTDNAHDHPRYATQQELHVLNQKINLIAKGIDNSYLPELPVQTPDEPAEAASCPVSMLEAYCQTNYPDRFRQGN